MTAGALGRGPAAAVPACGAPAGGGGAPAGGGAGRRHPRPGAARNAGGAAPPGPAPAGRKGRHSTPYTWGMGSSIPNDLHSMKSPVSQRRGAPAGRITGVCELEAGHFPWGRTHWR